MSEQPAEPVADGVPRPVGLPSRVATRDVLTGRTSRPGWGEVGSAFEHEREATPYPDEARRRRCSCCGQPVTHVGRANGLGMISGCELLIRRWIKDPSDAIRVLNEADARRRAQRAEERRQNVCDRCGRGFTKRGLAGHRRWCRG